MLNEPSLMWRLAGLEAAAGGCLAVLVLGLTAAAVKHWAIDPGRQGIGVAAAAIVVPITLGSSLWVGLLLAPPAVVAAIVVYHRRVACPRG
jgi:hypothetical protein